MREAIRLYNLAKRWEMSSKYLIYTLNLIAPRPKPYSASSVLYIEPNEETFWQTVKAHSRNEQFWDQVSMPDPSELI